MKPAALLLAAFLGVAFAGRPAAAIGPETQSTSYPLGLDLSSLGSKRSLLILGTAGVVSAWAWSEGDEKHASVQEAIDGSFIDPLADFGNNYGSSLVIGSASAGVLGYGLLSGQGRVREAGWDLTRSFVFAQTITGITKHAVDRTRPNGEALSFPSGHSTAAFSVVPAAWHYLGWKGGVGATTLATFTALGRLEDNRHYVSDVVAGGAIGLVVGLAVISQRENSASGPDVAILPRGMALSWHF